VYNLIISGNDEAWESSPYSLEVARLGEYTAEALRTRYQKLTSAAITELQSFPTLFAYEHMVKKAARFGQVTRISQPSGRSLRFHFKLYDQVPPIPYERVKDLTWELDIGEWEINRTHWAVKDVDLLDVLRRASLLTDAQIPPEFVDPTSPTPPAAVHLPVQPTVFAIPSGEPQPNLVAVMMPFAPAFDTVYATIQQACRTAKLTCERSDKIWEESTIIQDVFNLIYRSRIVVADLTDNNPNVMYEVGIAHTLGRNVVPIVQAPASRPFDIAHHRILDYVPDAQGLAAMQEHLARRLRHLAT
jgi:hypothetical protein